MQKILETLRTDYSAVVDEVNKGLNLGEISQGDAETSAGAGFH